MTSPKTIERELRRSLTLRLATDQDWPAIWPFFHQIVASGQTYTYEPSTDFDAGRRMWLLDAPGETWVVTSEPRATTAGYRGRQEAKSP